MNQVVERIQLIGDEPMPSRELAAGNPTPRDLVRLAMSSGADLDQVARYMQLERDWESDRRVREAHEALKKYNKAFAAFKAEAIVVIKNKTVTQGPLAGGKYAELFAVVNAVTPALSRHGLSHSWKPTKDEKDWIEITCYLKHEDGHSESVSMGGPPDAGGAKSALQARASTTTFLERLTLKAICGVAEQGDDNDGRSRAADEEANPLLEAGQAAAMEGMQALTAWWGSITARDRAGLNKQYPSLRKAAEAADADR